MARIRFDGFLFCRPCRCDGWSMVSVRVLSCSVVMSVVGRGQPIPALVTQGGRPLESAVATLNGMIDLRHFDLCAHRSRALALF